MTEIEHAISIFIFESDTTTVLSQKYLLETHNHTVKLVDMGYFETPLELRPIDIVVLDMGVENTMNFPILDVLLKVRRRPKILLTAFENQIFRKDDFLSGGPSQILFKPFSPDDLIEAISELAETSHV